MGMSFGFNRDFGSAGGAPMSGPAPGLGVGAEVVRRDFADSAFWTATLAHRQEREGDRGVQGARLAHQLAGAGGRGVAEAARRQRDRAVQDVPPGDDLADAPAGVREGDTVSVFGTVHNLSDAEQNVRVHLTAENGQVLSQGEQVVKVPPKGNVPVYWTYRPASRG
jgi:hypothetical protein